MDPQLKAELEVLNDEALHARLSLVDPPRAELLHPKVRRKVMRSLEIYYTTNKRHSDWIREQQEKARFAWERTCFFWVSCGSSDVLESRVRQRVDDMVSQGLKEELKMVSNAFRSKEKAMDWARGALQSIGLREFRNWMIRYEKDGTDDDELFRIALEEVKLHTRQYAKTQVSWIRNGILPTATVYRLDSSDIKKWNDYVLNPAVMIATMLIQGQTRGEVSEALETRFSGAGVQVLVPSSSSSSSSSSFAPSSTATSSSTTSSSSSSSLDIKSESVGWKKHPCEYCNRTLNGEAEWKAHQKSKGHKTARSKHFKLQKLSSASSSSLTQTTTSSSNG